MTSLYITPSPIGKHLQEMIVDSNSTLDRCMEKISCAQHVGKQEIVHHIRNQAVNKSFAQPEGGRRLVNMVVLGAYIAPYLDHKPQIHSRVRACKTAFDRYRGGW